MPRADQPDRQWRGHRSHQPLGRRTRRQQAARDHGSPDHRGRRAGDAAGVDIKTGVCGRMVLTMNGPDDAGGVTRGAFCRLTPSYDAACGGIVRNACITWFAMWRLLEYPMLWATLGRITNWRSPLGSCR